MGTIHTGRSGQTDGGFITQGDSNNVPDPEPVYAEQIVGAQFRIPGLGGALMFLRPGGILTGLFVLAAVFLADRRTTEGACSVPGVDGSSR